AGADSQSIVPLIDVAQLYERTGNTESAIGAYREALLRSPDQPVALNNLAYLLAKDRAKLKEATTLTERAYQQEPTNPAMADTLGWIFFQQGSLDRAAPLIEQAAQSSPTNSLMQYHLGAVYARLGKRAEARRALERALERPRFADAGDARKLLDSLR